MFFDWWHNGYNIKKFKLDRYLRGEAEKKTVNVGMKSHTSVKV